MAAGELASALEQAPSTLSFHLSALEQRFESLPPHILLLRDVLPEGVSREIPDPFGGNYRVYEESRDSMIEAIPQILEFLKKNILT